MLNTFAALASLESWGLESWMDVDKLHEYRRSTFGDLYKHGKPYSYTGLSRHCHT